MFDKIAETPVSDIESRPPVIVRTRTPLLSVIKAMHEGKRGAALVEDGQGKLLGIFTERHLLTQIDHSRQDWYDFSVDELMHKDPLTIDASHFVREALSLMSRNRIRQLPVMDTNGQVSGIISIRDILCHVAACFPAEFLNLPPDPEHEARDLAGG